ncbi:MAG: phosphoserine phosphatase RsbU/P [Candidatus Sumerlaeota bacterium]|nr:phosphoserine phosphatase RsbU/P [Candidatus Sumerlaeota bacterium]
MKWILILLLFGSCCWLAYSWVRSRKLLWEANYLLHLRDHERATVFSFLNEIGSRITKRLDLDQTLEMVVEFCCNATRAEAGAIFLKDKGDSKTLHARVVQGLFPPLHEVTSEKLISKRKFLTDYVKKERIQVGEGIIGHVAKYGESILIPNAREDGRVPRSANDLVPLVDLILAPLAVRGDVLGVLVLINKKDDSKPGATFDGQDLSLVTALADQASVTLDIVRLYEELSEKQRLEQELQIAHEFQAALLPSKMPEYPQIEIFGMSQPALEVGGDYFDFIEVDEHHLGIVVGDVSGKGIPGALVMATLRATLRAEAPGKYSPRAVLKKVNSQVMRDTKESVFISATYGILDLRSGLFRFARAGHEPLFCCAEGCEITSYEPSGIVLGMIEGEVFDMMEEGEVNLRNSGTAVLYTDGVPEAMNPQQEEYGVPRFKEMLRKHGQTAPGELVRTVMEDIGVFTEGIPQHDDITLVVIRWVGESQYETELDSAKVG